MSRPQGPVAPELSSRHDPPYSSPWDGMHENFIRTNRRRESELGFVAENNPFAFSPGQLSKLLNPKSLAAFHALGGLSGLEKGLRTNLMRGLSLAQADFEGNVSFENESEPTSQNLDSGRSSPRLSGTSIEPSSTDEAYSDRKRVFGQNKLLEKSPKSFLHFALMAINGKIVGLLTILALAILALELYDSTTARSTAQSYRVEGMTIFVAILTVMLVGAAHDIQKERYSLELTRRKEVRFVKVMRSGKTVLISVYDILVGDVIHLEPGDLVPVDGILVEGYGLKCDESSATGESDTARKTSAHDVSYSVETQEQPSKIDPFILSGSKIMEGVGTCLVTAVGVHSTWGRIMMSIHDGDGKIKIRRDFLASEILRSGISIGLLLFIMLSGMLLAQRSNVIDAITDVAQILKHVQIVTTKILSGQENFSRVTTFAFESASRFVTPLKTHKATKVTTISSDKTTTLRNYLWSNFPVAFTLPWSHGDGLQKIAHGAVYSGPAIHCRSRFVLPLRISNTEVDALPDTGADENAISFDCARRLGIKIERGLDSESSAAFRLANGRMVKSCGIVRIPLSFAKGNKKPFKRPISFTVFYALAVPMILGREFLKDTETLSRYTNRLKRTTTTLSSSIPRIMHLNVAKERMLCYVNGVPVYANADTGAEMNLASPEWAKRHGAVISKPDPGYEEVMLADRSCARILGQFNARFQVHDESKPRGKSRSRVSTRTFFILGGLTSEILLCQDLLFDVRAFKERKKSFVLCNAPTSGSFLDVNFVTWLSKREKRFLGFFKAHKEPNKIAAAVQSEAEFRLKLDDDDAREQHIHKHAKLAVYHFQEPERSRRLEAENKRHREYIQGRERREREYYYRLAVAAAPQNTISSC
ncbi:putative P-type calcium ATPase [Penicillium waksmanii]|uniref:putative P-type calcium ATPase n=1 Tax=Penicillium waksmanii TaxID=69791 RepID=UPI0025499F81|nr:putative P-type calcium ATPase [Penicillium waksmanii]KAJ5988572.1 putative P-type calcium ATPase [Penicillium waksmanii]